MTKTLKQEFEKKFPAMEWFDIPDNRTPEEASDEVLSWFDQKLKEREQKIIRKRVEEELPKWMSTHPCTDEEFWHVQNAIGNIVRWKKWYSNFISKIKSKP